jgi:hypothetical protein
MQSRQIMLRACIFSFDASHVSFADPLVAHWNTGMVKLSGVGDCSAEFNHTRHSSLLFSCRASALADAEDSAMKPVQLELNLWAELEDFQHLLDAVEQAVSRLPESQQLQVAGDALLRIAELCESRAEMLTTEWEEAYRDPIVGQGFFAEMVRQTVAVDLSELMEPMPLRKPRTKTEKWGDPLRVSRRARGSSGEGSGAGDGGADGRGSRSADAGSVRGSALGRCVGVDKGDRPLVRTAII